MADLLQYQESSTLTEYKELLQSQWTRPVACQDECDPPEACRCQRHIIHVEALRAWWARKASEGATQSKLHRLFDEVQRAKHRNFPLDYHTYFTGEHRCHRVFSRLLEQGCGHLIDLFYQSNMHDIYLELGEDYQRLRENLLRWVPNANEVDRIIEQFKYTRWMYCPLTLKLHVDRGLEGTKVVLPFCRKIKLNDKGATASVYWVAVQKDLISDEGLSTTLAPSVFNDPEFGECYQMALKSYCGNKKIAYDFEKEAFSGLKSNNDVPIVRYLGCYTHDYGEGRDREGNHLGKTYNLLLEFGEKDLMEYWADETTVPPVRAEEILREWKLLFEVADAIKHMHNLEVPRERGAPWKFYGWHADIKPDNILFVHRRFKLADFGYSRFARVENRHDGSVPTEYISGFTDTYGAPEISMKRPDGTMSGVTQSIDTWSFGCVLSVAATWIVLGFQGIRQYDKLRQLSPSNYKDGKLYDRFHDGKQVLPEIKKWHNYLRGHLRPSDTATPLVLDLIEHKMLQTETSDRLDLEALCLELQELVARAENKIKDLKPHSRHTDRVVEQALLAVEREAHQERSLNLKSTPLHQHSAVLNLGAEDRISRPTVQLQKNRSVNKKPLAVTMVRKELLEAGPKIVTFSDAENPILEGKTHKGDLTNSPIDEQSPLESALSNRKEKLRNFADLDTAAGESAYPTRPLRPTAVVPGMGSTHSFERFKPHGSDKNGFGPPLSSLTSTVSDHQERRKAPPQGPLNGFHYPVPTTSVLQTAPYLGENMDLTATPPLHTPKELTVVHSQQRGDATRRLHSQQAYVPASKQLQSDYSSEYQEPGFQNMPNAFAYVKPTQATDSESTQLVTQQMQSATNQTPQFGQIVPRYRQLGKDLNSDYQDRHAPASPASPTTSTSPWSPTSPSITVTQPVESTTPKTPATTQSFSSHAAEEQVVTPDDGRNGPSNKPFQELPSTVYDLPYDICRVRKKIDDEDQERKSKLVRLKGKWRGEERTADKTLAKAYNKRDIILVVDNGWTMFVHWPIVTFVAETLAKNAAGLDGDGIDLMFTMDGHTRNLSNIKGESGRQRLKQALDAAWPANSKSNDSTDMGQVFADISMNWKKKGCKPTTLLVLTDGDWSNTDHKALNETVLKFAGRDPEWVGKRLFSIQLIRFGEEHKDKLQLLDDHLCKSHNLKDIVDHCSWRTTVDKMFRGSVEGFYDQHTPPEVDITYDYEHLVTFFHSFNDNGGRPSILLSPDRNPSRNSLSRRSSTSTNPDAKQRKHESAPPPVRFNSTTDPQHRRIVSEHYVDKRLYG